MLACSCLVYHCSAPVVTSIAPTRCDTSGGQPLLVTGRHFNAVRTTAGTAGVSVWLSRGVLPAYPWAVVPVSRSVPGGGPGKGLLRCTLESDVRVQSDSALSCTLPAGTGVDWVIVVVNHDVVDTATGELSSYLFQQSTGSGTRIDYRPPSITAVASLPHTPRVAIGGFVVVVTGGSFGPSSSAVIAVTVGGLPCVLLANDDVELSCAAPPRNTALALDAALIVSVAVDGQSSNALPFVYDGPVVTAVSPAVTSALATDRPTLAITGYNFGQRSASSAAVEMLVVDVGDVNCSDVAWLSDALATCRLDGSLPVGDYPVTVSIPGVAFTTEFASESSLSGKQ